MRRIALRTTVLLVIAMAFATNVAQAQRPRPPPAGGGSSGSSGTACALDGTSSNVAYSIDGTDRVMTTNLCPNHAIRTINPNAATENSGFGVTDQQYRFPLEPVLAASGQEINLQCMPSTVGIARSGGVIFSVFPGTCGSDAVKLEGDTFDECAGHSENTGLYHYHMTPKCLLDSLSPAANAHSPILGYMLDGIPIYGPLGDNGAVPTDLDACGGHASDGGNNGQYHYHFKPVGSSWPDPDTPLSTASISAIGAGHPYTPGCMKGCVPDHFLSTLSARGTVPYSSYSACVASGGTRLTNVEHIGSTPAPATGATPAPAAGATPAPATGATPAPATGATPAPATPVTPAPAASTPMPAGSPATTPTPATSPTGSSAAGMARTACVFGAAVVAALLI